jgi:hypothetical protein
MFVLAASALGLGLMLNWSFLVAAGVAPLIISLLPCVAMCALGLCMNGARGRSCAMEQTSAGQDPLPTQTTAPEVPTDPRLLSAGRERN